MMPEPPDKLPQLRERLPVGEACLMHDRKTGPVVKTAWVLRRTDAHLAQFRGQPDCRTQQGGISCRITFHALGVEVRVVALAIRMGIEPFSPDSVSAAFINEYDPVCRGLLENLTTQSSTPVLLIGDTEPMDCIASVDNTLRTFAQHTISRISSTAP